MIANEFDLTTCGSQIPRSQRCCDSYLRNRWPVVANADGATDVLIHTFGFGTRGGPRLREPRRRCTERIADLREQFPIRAHFNYDRAGKWRG